MPATPTAPRSGYRPLPVDDDPPSTGTYVVRQARTGTLACVYQARFVYHVANGHELGRWYFKPVTHQALRPASDGHATREEAIAALDRWASVPAVAEAVVQL